MSPLRFLEKLKPVTTIHVDAGEVVFQRGADEARSQPVIRIAENGKIMAVGKEALTLESGRLVRLFEADAQPDADAIRAFCRHHFMLTAGGSLFRSRVTIVEPSFRKAFGRAAAAALQAVLQRDGYQAEIAETV